MIFQKINEETKWDCYNVTHVTYNDPENKQKLADRRATAILYRCSSSWSIMVSELTALAALEVSIKFANLFEEWKIINH